MIFPPVLLALRLVALMSAFAGLCGPQAAGEGYDRSNCDRSCSIHEDCKFSCGCGAVNVKEVCNDSGVIYDCVGHEVGCEKGLCVAWEERPPARQVSVAVDKAGYEPVQAVTVIIRNGREEKIVAEARHEGAFFGDNYGIGLVQRLKDGSWEDFEPLWRCADSCFAECKFDRSIASGQSRAFLWKQTRLLCDKSKRKQKFSAAPAGLYRIKISVFLDKARGYKNFYSPAFELLPQVPR